MRIVTPFALWLCLLGSNAQSRVAPPDGPARFLRPAQPAETSPQSKTGLLSPEEIAGRLRLFSPAALTADTLPLAPGDRGALGQLIEAAAVVERVYLRQNTPGGDTLAAHLATDTTAEGRNRLRYFLLNMSPWSSFDMNRAIVPGVPSRKPQQANLYPVRMLRSNWGAWFIGLDSTRQAEAAGPYHVVRFDSAGNFITVPYSTEYADLLSKAGDHLTRAAALATDRGLKEFLRAMAAAFGTNDYRECERAGMGAGGAISMTMGPTSLYLDNLFRYKRAFEVIVGVRNEPATRRLREMEKLLPEIAKELGEPAATAAAAGGKRRSVRIDDAAYIGGAARSGSIASTLRLPVDTTLIPEAGTKSIILRNVHEATFSAIQKPIAAAMLDSAQAALVGFDAHLLHLMMRELCARFEPANPWKAGGHGNDLSVAKDPASALSGARSDAAALIALDVMARRGMLRPVLPEQAYATQVSSLLRALRFWGDDPASESAAIQFNFHRDQGALKYDPAGGIIRIDAPKLKASVRKLHSTIAAIQARGDVDQASAFFARYSVEPPELGGLREQLSSLPVDIEPSFPLAN